MFVDCEPSVRTAKVLFTKCRLMISFNGSDCRPVQVGSSVTNELSIVDSLMDLMEVGATQTIWEHLWRRKWLKIDSSGVNRYNVDWETQGPFLGCLWGQLDEFFPAKVSGGSSNLLTRPSNPSSWQHYPPFVIIFHEPLSTGGLLSSDRPT